MRLTHSFRLAALALSTCWFVTGALAQSTFSVQTVLLPDEAHALAREMLDLEGEKDLYASMLDTMRDRYETTFAGANLSTADKALFQDKLLPQLRSELDALTDAIVDIYASTYSIEELRGIVAFDRSPLGRRIAQLRPAVAQRTEQVMTDWMQRALDSVVKQMPEKAK